MRSQKKNAGSRQKKPVLIGKGPIRVFMDDGSQWVSGRTARLMGLPNGSLLIKGQLRCVRKPARKVRRS